jgi:hypothetical protein
LTINNTEVNCNEDYDKSITEKCGSNRILKMQICSDRNSRFFSVYNSPLPAGIPSLQKEGKLNGEYLIDLFLERGVGVRLIK